MRSFWLTIDKLEVKLYDKVSSVIAEIIENIYDADAGVTDVTVQVPMGQYLSIWSRGPISDKGFEVEMSGDGTGMTLRQVQEFFPLLRRQIASQH